VKRQRGREDKGRAERRRVLTDAFVCFMLSCAGIGQRVSVFVIEVPPSSSLGQGEQPGAEPLLALLAAPASLSPDATPLGSSSKPQGSRGKREMD
jgi:hypothetical protein